MKYKNLSLVGLVFLAGVAVASPWRAIESNTSGWTLMTPKERLKHQATVRAFTDYASCRAYQLRHHAAMEARAQAIGQTLKPAAERRDVCAHLRSASEKN